MGRTLQMNVGGVGFKGADLAEHVHVLLELSPFSVFKVVLIRLESMAVLAVSHSVRKDTNTIPVNLVLLHPSVEGY